MFFSRVAALALVQAIYNLPNYPTDLQTILVVVNKEPSSTSQHVKESAVVC